MHQVLKSTSALSLLLLMLTLRPIAAQDKPGSLYDRFMEGRLMQSRLVQKFISSEKDSTRSPGFIVLPAFSYGPETGFVFGVQGVYNFYTDREDLRIRTSTINLQATLSTESQVNTKLTSDIWTNGNKNHYVAELRYRDFPFYFYGLGHETLQADRGLLTQQMFRLRFDYERMLLPDYFVGITNIFEYYDYFHKPEDGGIFPQIPLSGRSGGRYWAIGLDQAYDSRNNINYTTKGYLLKGALSYAPDIWGGENFNGFIANINLRAFFPINDEMTLGLNATYDEVFGRVPFYMLPQLGSDESMRGYYQGRYRDRRLLTSQAEFRYRFHPRLGVAAFAGAGGVYGDVSKLALDNIKPTYGAGLRYFFDIEHNTSLRLDYGVGQRIPGEPRQASFYISLGEAF